jgi:hypothetical protein
MVKNEYGEETVAGACLRRVYWEQRGIKHTNPMNARGKRITSVGKLVEQWEVEKYKEMGIWVSNNTKFFHSVYNISGEVDAIVVDEKRKGFRGIEIKTGYDYKFRSEVLGTKTRPGKPKDEHILQTMLYIDYFKFPFNIVYIDRGNAERGEYEITLNTDGTPNINGKKLESGLSIPRCLARYKELDACLKDGVVPKRDFQIQYSKERVKFLNDSARLNKGQQEEFAKNKHVDMGDWVCSYCVYKDHCWTGGGKDE